MNMEKIELLGTRDLRHFDRERQSVMRGWKQRVVRNVDSMEMKIVLRQIQPDRLSITEEKNFVAAAGQLRSQGCCQDSTPANQRKTCNPNFERPRFHHSSV